MQRSIGGVMVSRKRPTSMLLLFSIVHCARIALSTHTIYRNRAVINLPTLLKSENGCKFQPPS